MALVDGNQVIQTFSSNRSNQPFTERICLRCSDRRFDGGNPEVLDRFVELRRKAAMSIVNEEAIGVVAGNGFAKLLQSPISRGMLGHIEVNDAARSDFDQQQYIEDTKAGGDGDYEIAGDDRLGMIVDECVPGLRCRRWPSGEDWARPVGSYRAGRNLDAELQEQLIGDACLSPGRILPNHFGDQLTKARRNAWPPWSRFPLPEELEPLTVPADQGFSFEDDQSIAPIAEPQPE
jgi:hypothetical protein